MIKTIPEIVRERIAEGSEAALERFRSAVRPIYGSTQSGVPEHIGTALLLDLPEGRCLLTAAHVIDWNETTTLYIGGDDLEKLEFEASVTQAPEGNRGKDHADFAIARLGETLLAKLSGAKFISETEISRSVAKTEGRMYTCLGYPNSKNKINTYRGTNVTPKLGIYTSLGRPASSLPKLATESDHILVDFDAKYSRDESGAKVSSIALPGFSGGAIIDLGQLSDPASLDSEFDPKLAALLIEGHSAQKVILGTRITRILSALRDAKAI